MSDDSSQKPISKALADLNAELEKEIALDLRKKNVAEKDLILKEHRVNRDLDALLQRLSETEHAKTISFGKMSEEEIQKIVEENDAYMEAAKNSMEFINKEFKGIVPFFKRNLIVIGGDTGDGKSTTCANIIASVICKKDPNTGKNGKILVLSNEEEKSDIYNRVSALLRGWAYVNHSDFSDEQKAFFRENIPVLAKDGRLTVIGDVVGTVGGNTTTPEGIQEILDGILRDGDEFTAICLDYYQNVKSSRLNPQMAEWECQQKLCGILDQYKNRMGCPIIILAQMAKLVSEDDTTPFTVRLKGRKLLCDKATMILELIPERQFLRSKWKVWKSRFTEAVGKSVYTGYDRGRFVPYSLEFQKNVSKLVERNLEKAKEEQLGLGIKDEDVKNDESK